MKKWENAKLSNLSICETMNDGAVFAPKKVQICVECCHKITDPVDLKSNDNHEAKCPAFVEQRTPMTAWVPVNEWNNNTCNFAS